MNKSQIISSITAIMLATMGAFASTAIVSNTATAEISAPPFCELGTTIEPGCEHTIAAGRVRCTMMTSEGIKDAFFQSPACTTALWRQP